MEYTNTLTEAWGFTLLEAFEKLTGERISTLREDQISIALTGERPNVKVTVSVTQQKHRQPSKAAALPPPQPPGNDCRRCAASGVGACDAFPDCQKVSAATQAYGPTGCT